MWTVTMAFSNESNPVFREQFNAKVRELLQSKRDDNNSILTRERYNNLVATVKNIKVKEKKEPIDYRRIARYDVLVIGDREMLIKPIKELNSVVSYYIASDEMFDVIHGTHINIGHAGRNKMVEELRSMYCNITKEVIMIYLSLCQQCNQKKSMQAKKTVTKPSVMANLNARGHVDVIDMVPCGEYRYVMVYQDHLTKFVILKALQTNEVDEIAHNLLAIFATIGAPVILQSNNGRHFCGKIIKALGALWKDIKLVHGNVQGKSQTTNIKYMLLKWVKENGPANWLTGLQIVQFTRNCTYNEEIKKSAFEAMFGCKGKVSLPCSQLSKEHLEQIQTEEDLVRFMPTSCTATSEEITEDPRTSLIKEENRVVCDKSAVNSYSCTECGGSVRKSCVGFNADQTEYECQIKCTLCTQKRKKVKK